MSYKRELHFKIVHVGKILPTQVCLASTKRFLRVHRIVFLAVVLAQ